MAFGKLNEADKDMTASPAVEARLREEVRRLANPHRRAPMAALAIAASLILVVASSLFLVHQNDSGTMLPGESVAGGEDTLTGFVPLGYHAVPSESTHIVRLEVSGKALASFGLLDLGATNASESGTYLADVVIGDDGLARAVRFVRPVSH